MIGHKGLINRSLTVVDAMEAGQSFKKDFKAEEREHIIPTHDSRVIFAGARLSGWALLPTGPPTTRWTIEREFFFLEFPSRGFSIKEGNKFTLFPIFEKLPKKLSVCANS